MTTGGLRAAVGRAVRRATVAPLAAAGGERLELEIAGITIGIEGLPARAARPLADRFGAWTASSGNPAGLTVRTLWLPGSFRDPDLGRDEEYRLEDGRTLRGRASVAVGLPGPVIEAAVADDPNVVGQEIENILRLALAARLLGGGGLLLHAGAAALGRGAVVFPAPSGTGKSTLVRELAGEGIEPLGDDMAALVLSRDQEWTVRPVPFTGEPSLRGRPAARPLLAVHPLRRGRGPRLEPLAGAPAAAAIAGQTLGLTLFPNLAARGLATVARLAAAVPVESLHRGVGDDAAGLLRRRHGEAP